MSILEKFMKTLVAGACALLLGAAVLLVTVVPQAHAADLQGSTLTATAGVSDEVTKIDVAKVDAGVKHEPVPGAQLQILDKESGKVVYSWTSTDEAEQVHKVLNVNTAYILHEVSAPEGYETAPDTEFRIDDYGTVSFSTGGTIENNAELTDKYSVNLYDRGAYHLPAWRCCKHQRLHGADRGQHSVYARGDCPRHRGGRRGNHCGGTASAPLASDTRHLYKAAASHEGAAAFRFARSAGLSDSPAQAERTRPGTPS